MEYIALLSIMGFFALTIKAQCKFHAPNPQILTDQQGEITYQEGFRRDDCSWNLPSFSSREHALFIYLKNIHMTYYDTGTTGCSGKLHLPELDPICNYTRQRCFLYSTLEPSCTLKDVGKVISNASSNCTSAWWFLVETLPRQISIRAEMPEQKNFSIQYHFIKCEDKKKEASGKSATSNATYSSRNKVNITGTQSPASPRNNSPISLIVVVVILSIILVITAACIAYVRCKRRRRSKEFTQNDFAVGEDEEQTEQHPSNGDFENMTTNEYEEIPVDRFRSNSRELVANTIY